MQFMSFLEVYYKHSDYQYCCCIFTSIIRTTNIIIIIIRIIINYYCYPQLVVPARPESRLTTLLYLDDSSPVHLSL